MLPKTMTALVENLADEHESYDPNPHQPQPFPVSVSQLWIWLAYLIDASKFNIGEIQLQT